MQEIDIDSYGHLAPFHLKLHKTDIGTNIKKITNSTIIFLLLSLIKKMYLDI